MRIGPGDHLCCLRVDYLAGVLLRHLQATHFIIGGFEGRVLIGDACRKNHKRESISFFIFKEE